MENVNLEILNVKYTQMVFALDADLTISLVKEFAWQTWLVVRNRDRIQIVRNVNQDTRREEEIVWQEYKN